MSRARVERTEGRHRVNVSLDGETLRELDRLATRDGRDRSHQIEALVRAEVERERRREKR